MNPGSAAALYRARYVHYTRTTVSLIDRTRMTSIDFIILTVVSVFGASLIAMLVGLIFRSLATQGIIGPRFWDKFSLVLSPAAFSSRAALYRCERLLAVADADIVAGRISEATDHLERSFYLGLVGKSLKLCALVANHNTQVFDRLLTLARTNNKRVSNAEIVEELIESRAQMLAALVECSMSKEKIVAKQKARSGATPDWAAAEFDRKANELVDRLGINKRNITEQVTRLVSEIRVKSNLGSTLVH